MICDDAVEDEEPIVKCPGVVDGKLWILSIERVDVILCEPVARRVDDRRDAFLLRRENTQGVSVDVPVYKRNLLLGSAHEVGKQAERVEHLSCEEDPLGLLNLPLKKAEHPVETFVGRSTELFLTRFDTAQPFK